MGSPQTAVAAIPDSRGLNLFFADSDAGALFAHYLPESLFAHLEPVFDRLGERAGGRLDELAGVADRHPPVLVSRKRGGEDCNLVDKHPAWREMEEMAFGEFALAAVSHRPALGWPEPLPPQAKYALTYLFVQAEFGLMCPVSMTDSLTRTLRRYGSPDLVARFFDRLTATDLDRLAQGAMFMTEQGAGSDVAATTTRADAAEDGSWRLTGDKWFCSNADADLAMVLARSEEAPGLKGLSLFLMPKIRSDGTPNAYRILRLKEKLGTRAMPSGEIRLEGAQAWLVGERGRGFQQMADMINNSRLSNGVRAAGLMRRSATEALFIARHREAFGRRLIELPLMRRQLMKILVPTEQARTMMFLTAGALADANAGDAGAARLARILTPLIKFRACRDARKVTGDAMEVRGGCGYIEEWSDARLLRDAHLGSIWEGTSNIVALDVMRAIARDDALPAFTAFGRDLIGRATADEALALRLSSTLARAAEFAGSVAGARSEELARQAASGLYHVITAIGLAAEGSAQGLSHRMRLARCVLDHRLSARDPLARGDEDCDLDGLLPAA